MKILIIYLTLYCIFSCSATPLWGQGVASAEQAQPTPPNRIRHAGSPEELEYLAQPLIGITTNGMPAEGLFPEQSTGITTRPIQSAVNAFLNSLTVEQRSRCKFPITDNEWRRWSNTEFYEREGIGLFEMTENQRELALGILKESLSLKGFEKAQNIMKMEEHLAYLVKDYVDSGQIEEETLLQLGGDKFYFTFMGTPSDKDPWGWQIDGHHLVINYFILDDQVVMTPTLMGSEPTYAEQGPHSGLRTFEQEEVKGFRFYSSLSTDQKQKATLSSTKPRGYFRAGAFQDNLVLAYSGIPGTELSELQRNKLLELMAEYVHNIREGHSQIRMDEVESHLDETWFSWIGPEDGKTAFYYRIYSPVILIEFEHRGPVFLWDRNKPKPGPTKNHIHTIVRTPNGNDYGKDLLRQHLLQHH